MIVTTTPSVEGYRITGYYGIVFGEVITGINFLKDFGAGIRNLVGGRSAGYEEELMAARTQALEELQRATCSWSPPPAPPLPWKRSKANVLVSAQPPTAEANACGVEQL
ncbi:MAG: heavy metal-binding domain-containing protein [Adlercreutzia equolifaciens]|nr:heavy metal-binding domain-containing protein [Adlercreutzia equolifaciens]